MNYLIALTRKQVMTLANWVADDLEFATPILINHTYHNGEPCIIVDQGDAHVTIKQNGDSF